MSIPDWVKQSHEDAIKAYNAEIEPNQEYYYRYVDGAITDRGFFNFQVIQTVTVILHIYKVIRHMPKCVVIDEYGKIKYVLKDARRRYAYPTKELAMDSYKKRKQKQIQYAENAVDWARKHLDAVEGNTAKIDEYII